MNDNASKRAVAAMAANAVRLESEMESFPSALTGCIPWEEQMVNNATQHFISEESSKNGINVSSASTSFTQI